MNSDPSRSEEVVADYKKQKMGISALRHIHRLLQKFEAEHALDVRLAWIGMTLLIAVVAYLVFLFLSADSVILS